MNGRSIFFIAACFTVLLSACSTQPSPYPGPDKQGEGMLTGAITGAGAGAVTGAQLASATGPGAAVGAGFGAVAGGIRGFTQDKFEEELITLTAESRRERERAYAQEILADHYQRRAELHPTRDIFPADLFFLGDSAELRVMALPLVRELAAMHRNNHAWSRFAIASYVRSSDKESHYGRHLAEKRAENLGNAFISLGFEPRRLQARGVLVQAPVLIDPLDRPERYSAAIEFIATDR